MACATRSAAGLATGTARLPGASFATAVLMAPGTVVAELLEAASAEAGVLPCIAVCACAALPLLEAAVESVVSVWLIEINCSRLFTFTN